MFFPGKRKKTQNSSSSSSAAANFSSFGLELSKAAAPEATHRWPQGLSTSGISGGGGGLLDFEKNSVTS